MDINQSNIVNMRILNSNIGAFLRTYHDDNENKIIQGILNIIKFKMGCKNIDLKDSNSMSIALFELMSVINFRSSKDKMNEDFKRIINKYKI